MTQELDGGNLNALQVKGMVGFDGINRQAGHRKIAELFLLGHQIAEAMANFLDNLSGAENTHGLAADAVDFAQVIDAVKVIGVRVGVQHKIEVTEVMIQKLNAQIGRGVYNQLQALVFHVGSNPHSAVFGVGGIAFAPAS